MRPRYGKVYTTSAKVPATDRALLPVDQLTQLIERTNRAYDSN